MEILGFTLSGKQAMFKKPDVNAVHYYTYGHIHKPALLGLFGAVLGYLGYGQMKRTDDYPEYYQKLDKLQVSISPNADSGYFPKKIISYNNSVGYASREQGGNLIVKEQWLEEPSWNVFVLLDCEQAKNLAEYLVERKCVYVPYLGKNDHPADIGRVSVSDGKNVENAKKLDCLFPKRKAQFDEDVDWLDEESGSFKYEEALPVSLDKNTNQYVLEKFVYTDMPLCNITETVWETDGRKIIFY